MFSPGSLVAADFTHKSDGDTGTVITYTGPSAPLQNLLQAAAGLTSSSGTDSGVSGYIAPDHQFGALAIAH